MTPVNTPARGKSHRTIFLVLAAVLLAASGAGFVVYKRHSPRVPSQPSHIEVLVHLDSFVVNLADSGQRAYLRVGLDLSVESASKAENRQNDTSSAVIRDTVLEVLTSRRSDELTTIEDRRRLKDKILQELNSRAPALKAREVYFTEFLIQK